ncbi:MAG: NAD(P)/FAD-dependent oxidoreductase [Rhizobiaceae bacterium]|nr:NAD(P)/FAD-dependent oxidoreductase [Rhizobiaceae bacterium]
MVISAYRPHKTQNSSDRSESTGIVFDVAIIGAGVVGCAMARRFALNGLRVALLERGDDILSGASKANSAILHTGFDAPPGSLELQCIRDGYREYLDIHRTMNLPLFACGAMVVAWTEQEAEKLRPIREQALENGIDDVMPLERAEVTKVEPHLSDAALAGLRVPGEALIDPWSPFLAYVLQSIRLGAQVHLRTEVLGGDFDGKIWTLETARSRFRARHVVNCAGLYGDIVEQRLKGASDFAIKPRKGQFVVFEKSASRLLNGIVLPVPSEHTKGVVLTRTIFGNVLIGPTAEEQDDRARATVEREKMRALIDRAGQMLPAIRHISITAAYAGLRPASEKKEYRISMDGARNWITVGGIRSTGMTAALGIAHHVFGLYAGSTPRPAPGPEPSVSVPNLAEHLPRDWQKPGYDEIVCHCEMVTRRELEAALSGPLPAGDLGGLKRRTRCGMGQCQGFNCTARITALASPRIDARHDIIDGGQSNAG